MDEQAYRAYGKRLMLWTADELYQEEERLESTRKKWSGLPGAACQIESCRRMIDIVHDAMSRRMDEIRRLKGAEQ